jgi:two-component system response regulator
MSEQYILLVEDNTDDELLTLRAFKKNNILNPVVVARDGVEALDHLFGAGGRDAGKARALPQIILLDLNLPRLGGLDVLRRIRESPDTRLIPVVVLTSSREEEDIVRSYSLGANAFVRKPVEFDEFIQAVRTLGLFWLLLNVPAKAM